MKHSIVSPSKAHIWTNCTCYESYPSSKAGQLGTDYHAMAEKSLKENTDPDYVVASYVNFVRSKVGDLEIERPVPLSHLAPDYKGDLGQGYCDACIIKDDEIEIIDLKTGRVPVSPVGNMQLMIYAYCIGKAHSGKEFTKATLTIFQNDKPFSWDLSWEELKTFIKTKIEPKVYLVLSGEPVRKAGEYCKWCSVKSKCKTLIKELDSITDGPFELLQKAKMWQRLAEDVKNKIKDSNISSDDRIFLSEQIRFKWKKGINLPKDLYELTPVNPTKSLLDYRPELVSMVDSVVIKKVELREDDDLHT